MKSRKILVFVLALVMIFCITAPVYAANEHSVVLKIESPHCTLNGQLTMVDTANSKVIPVVESNRTLLPIRRIVEHFGGEVGWNGATSQVTCSLNGNSVVLTIDSNIALVNGKAKVLDVPARAREERTLVPVRFVSENLNLNVKWEPTKNLVIVSDQALPDDSDQLLARSDVRTLLDKLGSTQVPSAAAEDTLTVGGKNYFIGMTEAQLTSLAGAADDKFPSTSGYTCYIYGASDYKSFFMAGVSGGKVVALCSAGTGFSYMGKKAGATSFSFSGSKNTSVQAMTDENDNYILHCILLMDKSFRRTTSYSSDALYGESKLNFHLVNAFRQYHGLRILKWSDKAAASARLHSEDMAANDYFSHYSLDGRNPGNRMSAQGISWRTWGENIIAGYGGAIASHDGWVNSAGHRANMLGGNFAYLGVGFTYSSGSYYGIYGTQNFYA